MSSAKDRTLRSLCEVGSVRAVCLARGGEVLDSRFPFSEKRTRALCEETQSIVEDFAARGRPVERLVIGFDGGQLLVVVDGDLRLLLMHMIPDEADFIAKAARAFLRDFHSELMDEPSREAAADPVEVPKTAVSEPATKTAARTLAPKVHRVLPEVASQASQTAAAHSDADALWLEDFGKVIAKAEADTVEGESASDPNTSEPAATDTENPAERRPQQAGVKKATVGSVVVQPARLAAHQPQSTLPPQKKPRIRRSQGSSKSER